MNLLEQTVKAIQPLDAKVMQLTRERLDNLTKPLGSLGALEAMARQVAGITGEIRPALPQKAIILMAGDHGVVAEGVSAFPQEVTPQMVLNFARGGAAINVLARHAGAELVLVDVGVAADLPDLPGLVRRKIAYGTQNMAKGPAMTREQAVAALEVGIDVANTVIDRGIGLVGLGDMGIGNTTPSTAIIAVYSAQPVAAIVGRGTGINDEALARKVRVIEQALAVNRPDPSDPVDVLAKVGGLEIAGLAGVALGAAARRVPVVVDGLIAGAAVVIATRMAPLVKDYLIGSHLSAEPGHKAMLELVGIKPFMLMDMRLGEGTGAALGMTLVDAGLKILNEMATFAEASVATALEDLKPGKQ